MDAIEKRARELLAAQVRDLEVGGVMNAFDDLFVPESAAVQAIIAALTPPEGYRLVPVEPTDEEVRVANEAQQDFFDANLASRFFSSGHYGEESIRHSLRAVRAARPEVDR